MRTKSGLVAVMAVIALTLAGCANNTPTEEPAGSPGAGVDVEVDQAAADLLPADIADAGKLVIGIDPNYAPNEYKDDAGNPIGWAVELTNAMAAKLGVTTDYRPSGFDKIIPSITGGSYDVGMSSFTDNEEREKVVDFVNYYEAGIQWAQQIGKSVDPANACGLTVSVQATTYEETEELPAKSEECVAAGKEPINILKFETQDEATNALALGRSDAMSADSPITQYAVSQVDDKIELAGEAFDVAPYGMAVDKGSPLAEALQAALQSLVDDGTYQQILDEWGVADGGIDEITINAATAG
ncbi:ABC transporter substrate-binding protein [Salinibacterium sp. ZJ454]|uniref:ABC transporter substrate-binding protein n=1 Tax=Salinibacterium sp. ZJ454 TaxID=2708339 RepID=UPI00142117D0|nr:ABC transporter substrate-binding protein [Salinibacterium sp. ZJ454]